MVPSIFCMKKRSVVWRTLHCVNFYGDMHIICFSELLWKSLLLFCQTRFLVTSCTVYTLQASHRLSISCLIMIYGFNHNHYFKPLYLYMYIEINVVNVMLILLTFTLDLLEDICKMLGGIVGRNRGGHSLLSYRWIWGALSVQVSNPIQSNEFWRAQELLYARISNTHSNTNW